jgi:hypothetical protein
MRAQRSKSATRALESIRRVGPVPLSYSEIILNILLCTR